MKLLIVVDAFTRGGAERQAELLALNLKRAGHTVHVWGFESNTNVPLYDELIKNNICCRKIPAFNVWGWKDIKRTNGYQWNARLFFRFLREWWDYKKVVPKRQGFSWIIPFTPRPSVFALLYKQVIGAKYIAWNHRGGADDGGFPYNEFLRFLVRVNRPVILANSIAGGKFINEKLSRGTSRIQVIRNFSECLGQIDSREQYTNDGSTINIVHTANFYPEKDIETLIRAMPYVAGRHPQVVLLLVGRWRTCKQRTDLDDLAREVGVQARICFLGEVSRSDIQEILANASLGVLSSRSEGSPNAILEYMSYGLPVVATNISGIRELLPGNSHKYLFDIGDHQRCGELISILLSNRDLACEVGKRNREALLAEFNDTKLLSMWHKVLTRI